MYSYITHAFQNFEVYSLPTYFVIYKQYSHDMELQLQKCG